MYTPKSHLIRFTHSLRVDQLPKRFQELVLNWARHLPREERLQYVDGEFFMVVPFEMLRYDTISLSDLSAFTRRFNRLHEVENYEALDKHMASYPFQKWTAHQVCLDDYIDMMFMLHHFKATMAEDFIKPATLAIFVHD